MAFSPQRVPSRTPPDRGVGAKYGGWGSVLATASRRREMRAAASDDEDSVDSDDSGSYVQDSKGSMPKTADAGIGVKLEDEMNNDHLQKLQEIFEVHSI